jgi:ribosome biogenesis GTPase / thiamine phosphate phosphatase
MHNRYPRGYNKYRPDEQPESGFVCAFCGRPVTPDPSGTGHRNHCPWCLRSLHLDILPGDRASRCKGVMEPIAISVRKDKEWVIIHRCTECGVLKENRIAGDDNEMALLSIAVQPVARPPFPLDGLMDRSGQPKGR